MKMFLVAVIMALSAPAMAESALVLVQDHNGDALFEMKWRVGAKVCGPLRVADGDRVLLSLDAGACLPAAR